MFFPLLDFKSKKRKKMNILSTKIKDRYKFDWRKRSQNKKGLYTVLLLHIREKRGSVFYHRRPNMIEQNGLRIFRLSRNVWKWDLLGKYPEVVSWSPLSLFSLRPSRPRKWNLPGLNNAAEKKRIFSRYILSHSPMTLFPSHLQPQLSKVFFFTHGMTKITLPRTG